MTDQPLMQSPGEKLMALRVAAGRTLEDVGLATKIPPAMLQAIEMDEYHKISGELYVKSFLRSYAVEMGLEEEEILRLYGNFMGEAAGPGAGGSADVWQEEETQIKRLGLPWVNIGLTAGVVIILLAAVVYFLNRTNGEDSPFPSTEPDSTHDASQDQGDESTTRKSGQGESLLAAGPLAEAEAPVQNTPPTSEANPERKPVEVPEQDPADHSPPTGDILPSDPQEVLIAGKKWPVVLMLLCPEEVDIALKMDGQRSYQPVDWSGSGSLADGQTGQGVAHALRGGDYVIFWGAEDHFSLMVSDPTGIRASINGEFRDISGLGPGQEIILNDPAVIRSNLPSAQGADRP